MVAAAYACSTDTFTNGDATAEGGGGGVSKDEFCDAEANYFRYCSTFDAACIQKDLQNCGALYSDLTSGFATAIAHCMEKGTFACNTELSKAVLSQCMSQELAGYVNDSGTLAIFGNDFCAKCAPTSTTCGAKFASAPDQPGYLPSMFNDGIIKNMDDCLKQADAGNVAVDASTCLNATLVCEYIALGLAGPPEACGDP
jgi:hypothetical protein